MNVTLFSCLVTLTIHNLITYEHASRHSKRTIAQLDSSVSSIEYRIANDLQNLTREDECNTTITSNVCRLQIQCHEIGNLSMDSYLEFTHESSST